MAPHQETSFQPAGEVSAETARAELEAVLASSLLARAPSLSTLLGYLCEKYFQGQAHQLKEYTIAVDVFGRPSDFHQKEDAIVRVEIRRLREKLRQYYDSKGAGHKVQIAIPVGQYAPVFLPREDSASHASIKPATPSNGAAEIVDGANGHSQIDQADSRSLDPQTGTTTAAQRTGRAPARRALVWAGLVAMSLMIALLAAFRPWSLARNPLANVAESFGSSAPAIENAAGAAAELSEIRILAGAKTSKYVDHGGKVWLGDRYFNGGSVSSAAVSLIYRTQDPEIYQTNRHGDFSYDIPLKPGNYELRLHFAETFYGPEGLQGGGEVSRLFLVRANGQPLVRPLDVYSDAGGWRTAEIKVFKNISPAPDGFLHLEFLSWTHGKAFVNAIEALPAKPGAINPVRIAPRETPFYSPDGCEWLPDRYFKGGRIVARPGPVAGAHEPQLYQYERFGNFSYAIPVAPGRYTLTLRFAERFFGPSNPNPLGKGPGSRVFHVFCNGEALIKNFDIFKEAGGEDRAVVKKFTGLTPDAQGRLMLEFKPVVNYALINSIEVVDEAWK